MNLFQKFLGVQAGKLACMMILVLGAAVTFTGCADSSRKEPEATVTAEGMAECYVAEPDITYTVYVSVKTDADGKILSVQDAGTQVPDGKDSLYVKAQSLFDALVGKDAGTISEVDAVSGATCSSEAILAAVEMALESAAE